MVLNKKGGIIVFSIFLTYVVSYCVISSVSGSYKPVAYGLNSEGVLSPKSTFGYHWSILEDDFMTGKKNNTSENIIGGFYKPLLYLDRIIWHRKKKGELIWRK